MTISNNSFGGAGYYCPVAELNRRRSLKSSIREAWADKPPRLQPVQLVFEADKLKIIQGNKTRIYTAKGLRLEKSQISLSDLIIRLYGEPEAFLIRVRRAVALVRAFKSRNVPIDATVLANVTRLRVAQYGFFLPLVPAIIDIIFTTFLPSKHGLNGPFTYYLLTLAAIMGLYFVVLQSASRSIKQASNTIDI